MTRELPEDGTPGCPNGHGKLVQDFEGDWHCTGCAFVWLKLPPMLAKDPRR